MDYPAEATFFVRLSLMIPKEGMEDEVLRLHEQLVEWLQGQPGFLRGYIITAGDPEGRIGHLNVYRTIEDADRAALSERIMAIRSELLLRIEEDSHAERSWAAYDPQLAQSGAS